MKKLALLLVLILAVTGVLGSGAWADTGAATDYAAANNWLSRPENPDKSVDIFYLYPTVWAKVDASEPNICAIDNASMRERAPLAFQSQATAYETVGNVYAPYYRQADAPYTLSLSPAERDAFLSGVPKTDVVAAFDYYMQNENQGRPFILAGHSQGSSMLLFILSDYMKENPAVYARMVAAYVIGYSITEDFLAANPHLKFAESATDTGVIISYNTEMAGFEGENPVVLPGSIAINPLSWTRTEQPAGVSLNVGSRTLTEQGLVDRPGFADAAVNLARGTVMCSTVDPDAYGLGMALFPRGVYHGQDYEFYYYNLRENAVARVSAFLGK